MRRAEFPVIHGLENPKLLDTGTCASTSTRHMTLKSPLLLQFPRCKLCDNDKKQSNHRLMEVLCRTKAIFANFSKSPKYNKLQMKETLRFSNQHLANMHLFKREIFHSYKKCRKFFTFPSFLNRSSCITSYKIQVYLAKWPPRARFFYGFQRWNDGFWRGIKISVVALWQGEIFHLKDVKYSDESKSLKTQSFICLCWLTSRQSNWLILASDIY